MKRFIAWLTYKPEPVESIRRRARRYLATHPSITVYDMVDGKEVNRRPGYTVTMSMFKFSAAFVELGTALAGMEDAVQDAMLGFEKFGQILSDVPASVTVKPNIP